MSPSVEPFNEAKYKALMDGLECNEVLLSNTRVENPVFRFDAEYFNKEVLSLVTRIKTKTNRLISSSFIVSKLAGFEFTEYFTPKNMSSNDCYIALTSKNVHQNQLDLSEFITIDRRVADVFLKRSSLKKNDVVLSYTGEYRRALTLFDGGYQLGPNVCRLTPIDRIINPHYLSVFLNSAVGQKILDREKTLSAQPTVAMSRIRAIRVPVFSKLQIEIEKLITISNTAQGKAGKLVGEAVEVLDRELDIESVQTSTISIKTLKDSFEVTGRLDAEYYQPKYDALFKALAKISTKILGGKNGIVDMMKSIEPGSEAYVDEGIPFIRVSDMSKYEITEAEIKLDPKVIPSPEKLFPKKDTILFSKDGSVGIAYKVEDDMSVITSGALLHLTVRDTSEVLPDYLTLVLNSPVVQLQAERDSNGAIIQHWKPSEIENVVIPVLDMEIQKEISAKVQESFALRRKSKQLLDYAKQAVEMAIEQGEDVAIEWLKEKVGYRASYKLIDERFGEVMK